MAKKESYSPVRTGFDPRKESTGDGINWVKLQGGQHVDLIPLVEIEDVISVDQCAIWLEDGRNSPVWVYTGSEDPSHDLGIKKSYKAFLPVLEIAEGGSPEVKVWAATRSIHTALLDIADAGVEIKGLEIRVKRTGTGLATRYSVVNRGKRRDVSKVAVPDIIPMLGPLTPDGVKALVAEKLGFDNYDGVLEKYRKGGAKRTGVMEKKKKEEVVEEDDDIFDEDEEESLEDIKLI